MKYFVIDLETTGLDLKNHEITEVSILDCQSLEQIIWFVRIRHPEKASKEALMITGKRLEDLVFKGRYVETILDEINDFVLKGVDEIDEICMIAHNASFDRRFVENAFAANDKKFIGQYWLDTAMMARRFSKTILKLKRTSVALGEIVKTANVKNIEIGAHSAEVDVRNTFRLWKLMVQKGMSNTEFIKMSPSLLPGTMTKKTGNEQSKEQLMEDVMCLDECS